MFVTVDDVVARLGRPVADDAERARILAYIEDATALVLDWCQTDFQQHQAETFELLVEGGQVDIPPRYLPGLSVASVALDGRPLSVDEWRVLGRTLYLRRGPVTGLVTLIASWGRPSVPPVIRQVIASEVIRWLAVSPGTVLEKTGELEVQYAPAANFAGLSLAAKDSLKRYRKRATTIALHRTRTVRPGGEEVTWPCSTTT
ncbi:MULTISPECIES: hypothetical protein [Streptomycetaceae]|uniref:Phage gp6-like head-tail connector protein n=1 Tax=Streptantibioticus cattleyicolor (strain ATCC 35852 / DSM 46488 / JCM 4925 / NBRC 14057 / NRRL 8057) TaxID=1003195 RepID=F8JYT9_STREN|nr:MULTISPECIES: hypothetical protein [Streptomycetaceae]AEW94039.1 hypothetical protein SCATT_16680 [Streptantibioticus cattleyicolor NRRL 8057 = DSM 46488]MYS58713.1 hypothetical protein [Streptomyces sp. SID5468]CCB74392.1 protein of unknown function [Streptantibioticus cattleyicolor NRRL 8057 = DSM 46488]